MELGINPEQLAAVRAMGTEQQGNDDIIPRDREACYNKGDIPMVGHPPENIGINNTTHFIATIGNHFKLGKILEDLRIDPYKSWGEMNNIIMRGIGSFYPLVARKYQPSLICANGQENYHSAHH